MSAKKKRTKDSKSNDLEVESKQVSERQSKDVEMNDESNLDKKLDENEEVANDVEAKTSKKVGKKIIYKSGLCVKCKKVKKIRCHSMCQICYKKHLEAKREKQGQQEPKHLIICLKCNLLKKHYARRLCSSCYHSIKKDSKKLKEYALTKIEPHYGKQDICVKCSQSKTLYERFMCSACYKKDKIAKYAAGAQKCGNCGMLELLELNGFCSNCNSDERVRKMADGSNLIDQKLEVILKSIEENESILSANMTVNACLATYAKYFEQFSKIKIEFLNFVDLDDDQVELKSIANEESSGPSKYSIENEDFIDRLKQYTRSKLIPLKKQSNTLNTENASSIFNVSEKRSVKPTSSKIKSPSKPKAKRKVNLKECIDCKQMKPHSARGRCGACYRRFMKQKKKDDAEKAKNTEQVEENSSQNVEIQEDNADQVEAPSVKPKNKRAKKQSNDA